MLPVLHGLLQHLEHSEEDSKTIASFKEIVKTEIKERWQFDSLNTSNCMVLSSILDPRFKPLKFLKDEEVDAITEVMIDKVSALSFSGSESTQDVSMDPPPTKTTKSILSLERKMIH